jgi:predicted amino acid dehydrogenase
MLAVAVGVDRETIERESGALFTLLGKGLAPFAASYLLNVTRVRVAPTLHAGNVLRVQPPLTVTRDECDWIIEGFASLASVIAEGRSDEFVRHLLRSPDSTKTADAPKAAPAIQPKPPARRSGAYPVARAGGVERDSADEGHFGFIVHFLDGKSISEYDKSLAGIDPADLEDLASRFEDSVEPFVASTVTIESEAGRAAKGTFIALPRTTRQLLRMSSDEALDNVGAAIRLAKSRGARIVGLGGYTSVIVQNFKPLLKLGVALTTGNSYTVVSAIDAAMEAARITSRPLAAARTAVVGGAGSIGSALASLLAERVPSLVLVGRDGDPAGARSRFATIVARMMRHAKRRSLEGVSHAPGSLAEALSEPACAAELAASDRHLVLDAESERRVLDAVRGLPVRWTTDLPATIGQSDLVFLATSSPDELVTSAMVRPGTVICDLSRPANVGDELHVRSDVLVIDGGIVEIPGRTDLGFHFGLAPGHAYACMAETMMLSLERMYEHTSMGRDLSESTLGLLKTLAGKHGFRLADLRARQRPLDFGGLGRPLPAHTSRAHLLAG